MAAIGGQDSEHLRGDVQKAIASAFYADDYTEIWSACCPALPAESRLLIDRVHLTCDVLPGHIGAFAQLAREDAFWARHGAYRSTWTSSKRRGLGHMLRVSYLPRFDAKRPYAVISFVPPYLFERSWRQLIGVQLVTRVASRLSELLALTASVRVTKLDIAVDVAAPIWSLQVLCTRSRRFRTWPFDRNGEDDDRARTVQSGSRHSDISLSTYDKRIQMLRGWRRDIGGELTRIEARVKVDVPVVALATLPNPFNWVTAHYLEPARDSAAGFKLAVRTARLIGLSKLRPALERSQYADLLAQTEIDPTSWPGHPRRVFDRHWRRVAYELLRSLGAT